VDAGVAVPMEAIVALRRRLAALPIRHPERLALMDSMANLYAVSRPPCIAFCVAIGVRKTRTGQIAASRASCRRWKSNIGARSSLP